MLVKRLLEYRINPAKFAENRKDYKTANEIIGDATRVLVNAEVEDTRQYTKHGGEVPSRSRTTKGMLEPNQGHKKYGLSQSPPPVVSLIAPPPSGA